MEKFFNALDSFFGYVRKHYGAFYWLCWLYVIILMILQLTLEIDERIIAVLVIPLHLISWPVFIEAIRMKGLPLPVLRTVWAFPAISTLMPICFFII